MNVLRSKNHPLSTTPCFVCESGRRWSDAARRFVGPFQHASQRQKKHDPNPRITVCPIELTRVRAAIAAEPDVAILFEVTAPLAETVALTIAQIGVGRPEILQLAAIDFTPRAQADQLGLRLLEFGVGAVVRDPIELAAVAPLIQRHFERRR